MLSFRFDLTSRQIETLMQIYSGSIITPSGEHWLFKYPHFMTTSDVLRRKGLVKHINDLSQVELKAKLKEIGYNNRKDWANSKLTNNESGYFVTERGRQIAILILEDAEKLIKQGEMARKRGTA